MKVSGGFGVFVVDVCVCVCVCARALIFGYSVMY